MAFISSFKAQFVACEGEFIHTACDGCGLSKFAKKNFLSNAH